MDEERAGASPQPSGEPSPPASAATIAAPREAPDLLDVVRASLLLYLKNWWVFFFPYLGVGLATTLLPLGLFGPSGGGSGYSLAVAPALTWVLPSLVIGGAALFALERQRGHPVGFREAMVKGIRAFPSIFGATLLLGLLIAGVMALAFAAFALGDVGLGFVGLIVGGVFAVLIFASLNLYAPVIMVEGLGPVASLRRSWELTRWKRKALFGVYLSFLLLAYVVYVVFNIPVDLSGRDTSVAVLVGALRTALLAPWFTIAGAVAYGLVVSQVSPAPEPRPSVLDSPA